MSCVSTQDIATIVAGSAARQTFVSGFKSNIAAALNGIDSDDVTINSITAGSVVVGAHSSCERNSSVFFCSALYLLPPSPDYTITASPSVATAAKTALAALPVADLSFGAGELLPVLVRAG